MQVDVKDRLSGIPVAVQDKTITVLRNSLLCGEVFCHEDEFANKGDVLFGEVICRGNMLARHNKDMRWRLGIDVSKRHNILGFKDLFSRYLPACNLTKQTISHIEIPPFWKFDFTDPPSVSNALIKVHRCIKEYAGAVQVKMTSPEQIEKTDSALETWCAYLKRHLTRGDVNAALGISKKAVEGGFAAPAEVAEKLGTAIAELYDQFLVEPVERFAEQVDSVLPEDAAAALKAQIEPRISLTHKWKKKIEDLFAERTAREIHDAIRTEAYDAAIERCEALFATTNTPEGQRRIAALLGNIFGTLENAQSNVAKVIRRLYARSAKSGISHEMIGLIESATRERLTLIYKSHFESRNVEWNRGLATTAVEMKQFLPLPTEIGKPEPDDNAKFDSLIRSILRCLLLPPHRGNWYDIVLLLVEFCPREVSIAGASSGVEARLFNALTPRQKRVAISVLTMLGKNKSVVNALLKFARANQHNRYHQLAIELLGGLKAEESADYVIQCIEDRRLQSVWDEAVGALGTLASPRVRTKLLTLLREILKSRTIGPQHRKKVTHILKALAKISRNKNLSPKERNTLIRDVIEILGDKDRRLNVFAAQNFFLVRSEEINPAFRAWAVERLVEGLWLQDTSPAFAKGPLSGAAPQRTFLGHREQVVDTLVNLGPEFLPNIIEMAERFLIHYSGAYMAIGEVLAKIGDERAVPLLDKLLTATLVIDDSAKGKYEKEHYWDGAAEARKVLNKD